MQSYYFMIEKREENACTFAYIWSEGESDRTRPPVKEFHSIRDGDAAIKRVAKAAYKWIDNRGLYVHPSNKSL